MDPIVIIGTGLAGYTTAREFRKLNKEYPLLLVTEEDGYFYSKPMLSNALSTGKTPQMLATQTAEQMSEQLNATIIPHRSITHINKEQKHLIINNETLCYDKLVLATGATPKHPSFDGNAADRVLSINNLQDYRHFRDALKPTSRVAIVGAGLIGCEFANDLAATNYHVDVIAPIATPMGHLLPQQVGINIKEQLGLAGVNWHLEAGLVKIDQRHGSLELTLDNGTTIHSNLVISAIGLTPNTILAERTGLAINKGIATNSYLQTSHPDVYALGDCAEVEGLVLPFVLPIMNAAKALAYSLNNQARKVSYPPMPVVMKTPACPTVFAIPQRNNSTQWEVQTTDNGVRCLLKNDKGELAGFVLTGEHVRERQKLTALLPSLLNS